VLGLSEGGLGGQDAPDGFPASGRNAYPPGANAFFADEGRGTSYIYAFILLGSSRDQI